MRTEPYREDDRSLPELFSDVTRESSELVRKEIQHAKLEVMENISELKVGATSMMLSLPLLYAGLLILLVAALLALDLVLQRPWLSALLVGGGVTLIGVIALLAGRAQVRGAEIAPQRSVESLREDRNMVRQHVGSSPN
jgi:hypothetical protein